MSIPETPYTRLEMYLDEIARNGGGGGGGGGGSSTLSGLTDVDISNPTDGQTLVYNATSGKWENGESAGGGVLVVTCIQSDDTLTLDKTWQEIYDAGAVSIIWVEVESGIKRQMFCKEVASVTMFGGDTVYYVTAIDIDIESSNITQFETNSASGYPSFTFE